METLTPNAINSSLLSFSILKKKKFIMTPQEINSNQPLTKKNTSTHIFQDQIKDKFEKKSYLEVWLRFVYFIIQWWHRRNNLKGNLQNNRIICVNGIKNRLKCGTMSTLCLLLETNRKIYNYCPQLEILALLQERRWLVLSTIIVISFFSPISDNKSLAFYLLYVER